MRRWIVILASLALVFALARAAGFATIGAVWRAVDPAGIAVSASCYYAAIAVRILAWQRLLGPASPPLRRLAPPLGLGFVLSHVAPAKSGEPAAALLLARAAGLPRATTLSILTAERGLQFVALLATFVPAAAFTAGGRLPFPRAAAALLALCLVALPLAPALLRRAARRLAPLPRVGPALERYAGDLAGRLASPRTVVPLLGLSVTFWALQYASLAAILRAGGVPVNPAQAVTVAGAAILGGTLSLLPLGTQDGISALALSTLGVPLSRGFSLALFHSALSLACGAALAAVLGAGAARSTHGKGSPSAP